MPFFFQFPRPTKLLIEPAACKSLKILEVASRALASLLITERGICGNRTGNRAAAEATLARPKAFSLGERAKKIPTDKGWDFEYWWWNAEPNPRSLSEADSKRTRKCPCFRAFVLFPSRALSTEGRRGLGWRARKQSLRRTPGSIPHLAIEPAFALIFPYRRFRPRLNSGLFFSGKPDG